MSPAGWGLVVPGSATPTGLRLLGTYATTPATDEATPRTITLAQASTPGRDLLAINHGSVGVTMPAGWTSVSNVSGSTVYQVWRLSKANNTGISSIQVTQGATAYPFAMTILEDDIGTIQVNSPFNGSPSGTLLCNSATLNAAWRVVGIWGLMTFQSQVTGTISGYSNGLAQIADTGPSSIFNSAHASWYSNRTYVAHATGLSGSIALSATAVVGNTGTYWGHDLAYSIG